MNSVRFESSVKKIEVNDNGEYVTIDTGDNSFYENFKGLQNWLEAEGKRIREREKERDEARNNGGISIVDDASSVIDEFVNISKEMNKKIDALFGEGALRKAFPDTKSPTLDRGMEFVSAMIPFVEEFIGERNKQIGNKYNANRKGARSK